MGYDGYSQYNMYGYLYGRCNYTLAADKERHTRNIDIIYSTHRLMWNCTLKANIGSITSHTGEIDIVDISPSTMKYDPIQKSKVKFINIRLVNEYNKNYFELFLVIFLQSVINMCHHFKE